MVEFTLPANSKVLKGINHPIKEVSEKLNLNTKIFQKNIFEIKKPLPFNKFFAKNIA